MNDINASNFFSSFQPLVRKALDDSRSLPIDSSDPQAPPVLDSIISSRLNTAPQATGRLDQLA